MQIVVTSGPVFHVDPEPLGAALEELQRLRITAYGRMVVTVIGEPAICERDDTFGS